MTALSPKARDLFARARAEGAPSAAERARILERVSEAIMKPSGAPPAGPPAGLSVTAGMLLTVVALGTIGLVSWSRFVSDPSPRTQLTPTKIASETSDAPSRPSVTPAQSIAGPLEPAREIRQPDPTHLPTHGKTLRPRRVQEENSSDLAAELAILRTAQHARRAGDLPGAHDALDEHDRLFPQGILANEREVARATVVCESGDVERGRQLAARFASTAWAGALGRACGLSPTESPSTEKAP